MVNFTMEQVRKIMERKTNIRNFCVIAHVDHGKSTLCDSLIAGCGLISLEKAGSSRVLDTREDEQSRTITIKSTGISLYYKFSETFDLESELETSSKYTGEIGREIRSEEGWKEVGVVEKENEEMREFLFNLIDSPGHVDFSSEVTAALRISDGALVVVDCIEGICVQTETVVRQALTERIKPVLAINKLDRAFLEVQLEPEEMYQNFVKMIENMNVLIATYSETEVMGDLELNPMKGNVSFCAGVHGWAFTLEQFSQVYVKKFKGLEQHKLMSKLWGDHFYDPETKKWTCKKNSTPSSSSSSSSSSNTSDSSKKLKRGFCKFILEPIQKVHETCFQENKEEVEKMIKSLDIELSSQELETLRGKTLLKTVMQRWLPAHKSLLEMIKVHLPSPKVAQKYRVDILYSGPLDDETAKSIRECDSQGPLVVFISKMVPMNNESGRFYAFGRVFSGTVKTGMKVKILGQGTKGGGTGGTGGTINEEKIFERVIQRTVVMMGKKKETMEDVPCGNTVGIVGIDQYLHKTGTLTSDPNSCAIVNMKYSVSTVVRIAVRPKLAGDLPKLIEGMKLLSQSDPLVVCSTNNSNGNNNGEYIIEGVGELHLEICLKDLVEFMKGIEIVVSQPIVNVCETVTETSDRICLAKSSNKLNRLFVQASPMGEPLCEAIENGKLNIEKGGGGGGEVKQRAQILSEQFGWDNSEAKKIWCFGPETNAGTNVVVDTSKGVQYLNEIKDSVMIGFQWASVEGVLCEENLRGVRFNIIDALVHSQSTHRGGGQIVPTARRVFASSQLTGQPALLEPIYLVEIQAPQQVVGQVYSLINKKRGQIISETQKIGTPLFNIQAHLPVLESFGFNSDLRAATSGKAFPQCIFDHWALVQGSPLSPGTKAFDLVQSIRARKGLPLEIPSLDTFLDRL